MRCIIPIAFNSIFALRIAAAFVPSTNRVSFPKNDLVLKGYLDDLTKELYSPDNNPDIEATSKEATDMKKEDIDRYGPSNLNDFVDFEEFDGGDGQMGVAGDGNTGLEKIGAGTPQIHSKSRQMSAKNAWGSYTGYADNLVKEGMDIQKAQRLENWQNQREVRKRQLAQRSELDKYDVESKEFGDEDWRSLAKFGVERNDEFDLDATFGAVVPGNDIVEVVELKSELNKIALHEFKLKNELMGFADFRAAFTADSNQYDWSVEPREGAIKSSAFTDFVVKFRPNQPGISQATLVIDTEDMKKTYKFIGATG